ncbi:MAG: hypothetical protein A3F78_01000 [Burkholderiales bacterium RIFCSPLOWO2_12_FULL_61_40]|nr:MAG: hypothetical protein A3F78_01000 [Burkholderiales bacterium RIFCSPLOWO2_12_FULL_61_40]
MRIDVCNGDADGLCSVVQWRLHAPQEARLVTGLKRDIELLDRVQAQRGDEVLVCDLSMRRNHQALVRLLDAGASVRYFDHHAPGDIPVHPLLEAHIDTAGDTCSSLLVDRYLGGQFRAWAVVGAYGDNLNDVAERLAVDMGLSAQDRMRLRSLGEAINYNAYGDSVQDIYMAPEQVYEVLVRFADPLELLEHEKLGQELNALRQGDLRLAQALAPYRQTQDAQVYLLPDAAWSRRVIGTLGNALASAAPARAHALLRAAPGGGFVVSVRAPQSAPGGAVDLCRRFGGDGRAGSAGIDQLPPHDLERFLDAFLTTRWGETSPARGA